MAEVELDVEEEARVVTEDVATKVALGAIDEQRFDEKAMPAGAGSHKSNRPFEVSITGKGLGASDVSNKAELSAHSERAVALIGAGDKPAAMKGTRPKRKLPRLGTSLSVSNRSSPVAALAMPICVTYVRHVMEAEAVSAELIASGGPRLFGLDIEWKVEYVQNAAPRPTATIQLATSVGAYVFHIAHFGSQLPRNSVICTNHDGSGRPSMPGNAAETQRGGAAHQIPLGIAQQPWSGASAARRARLPPSLRRLLEDPEILKVGVGISSDGLKLRADFGVQCAGLLDLSRLAALVLPHGHRPWSLAELCERVLGKQLQKRRAIRCSNWEAALLSPEQLEYAALDAWASLEVYRQLLSYPSAPAVLCNDGGKPCISAIPPAPYVMPAPPLQLQPDPLAVCTRTVPAALSNKSLHGANSTAAIGLPAKLVSHVASSTLAHEY